MAALSSLALIIAALGLAGAAAAEDQATANETTAQPNATVEVTERGLKSRIPLARNEERLYAPSPTAAGEPAPAETPEPAGENGLGDYVALNLNPTQLRSPNEAGRRLGYGNVVLSVPLNGAMDLRTGLRLDYKSSPGSGGFDTEATPTIGVGLQF